MIVEALGAMSRLWLDRDADVRREAVAALKVSTGFDAPMIETALNAAFGELSETKLRDFCQSHPVLSEARSRAPKKVLHILAGNVFTSWLPGAVITLLAGADCSLKPSTSEPVFAPLWKRSVGQIDPALGGKIRVLPWNDRMLGDYEAVVAYGTDETLAKLRQATPATARFIGYGHKISVGIVFKEALARNTDHCLMEQIRRDYESFNGQGCLSPQIIYVERDEWRGKEEKPVFKSFSNWQTVERELGTYRPHLSALGYAGPESRIEAIRAGLETLGFTRVCPLGEMQRPPLTWRNGGMDLVEELLKG